MVLTGAFRIFFADLRFTNESSCVVQAKAFVAHKNGDDLLSGVQIKGFNTLEEAQRRWGERFAISHGINTHLRLGFGGLHGKNINMHPVLQHSVQFTHSFRCFCYTYLEM